MQPLALMYGWPMLSTEVALQFMIMVVKANLLTRLIDCTLKKQISIWSIINALITGIYRSTQRCIVASNLLYLRI